MSSTSEPQHLSNHHRNTLRQLFQHPVSDPPTQKDIDTQAVVELRRMLRAAGYGAEVEQAEAKGQED